MQTAICLGIFYMTMSSRFRTAIKIHGARNKKFLLSRTNVSHRAITEMTSEYEIRFSSFSRSLISFSRRRNWGVLREMREVNVYYQPNVASLDRSKHVINMQNAYGTQSTCAQSTWTSELAIPKRRDATQFLSSCLLVWPSPRVKTTILSRSSSLPHYQRHSGPSVCIERNE